MKPAGVPTSLMKGHQGLPKQPLSGLSVTKLLLDIAFLRILLTIISPFRSFFAWQLFCGRSLFQLAVAVERSVLRTTGWLSAPPKSRALRHLFFSAIDVRRWHIAAGTRAFRFEW